MNFSQTALSKIESLILVGRAMAARKERGEDYSTDSQYSEMQADALIEAARMHDNHLANVVAVHLATNGLIQ